jgi:NAD(P)-dependent dehydrogenase (short-subunit alcohol dehydrogenase family)
MKVNTMSTSDVPVVIVTGASRGLGAATALEAVRMGAAVTLMARGIEGLAATAATIRDLGGQASTTAGDVADYADCVRCLEATLDLFGRVDGLINNAGTLDPLDTTAQADPAAWQRNLQVNVTGPFNLIHAALSEIKRRKGRIVNVSSGAAEVVIQAAGAYCAAKAALNHFTRVLAAEEPRITAVAVRPGVVDTAMQQVLRDQGSGIMPDDQAAYYRDLKINNQLEPPEVPGRALAWLALQAPHAWSGRYMSYDDPDLLAVLDR